MQKHLSERLLDFECLCQARQVWRANIKPERGSLLLPPRKLLSEPFLPCDTGGVCLLHEASGVVELAFESRQLSGSLEHCELLPQPLLVGFRRPFQPELSGCFASRQPNLHGWI